MASSIGSESPRSIRDYHRGSGNLQGGGVQEVYTTKPSLKKYRSKLDSRLGQCIFVCFVAIASMLMIYGLMHQGVHSDLTNYVNRTHQIAQELKTAMDENYPKDNLSSIDSKGREWMTVEELEDYAVLLDDTHSTIWWLFVLNLLFLFLLTPVLCMIKCDIVEGTAVKFAYRAVLLVCLIFCVAQLLYLLSPVLWGAARFPSMVDRLFGGAYPRDEYQINGIRDKFSCEFEVHELLEKLDLQRPCMPKIKNSLFPAYAAIFLIIFDVLPFAFAVFTYAWDACIKNNKFTKKARTRIELNNQRRVAFPTSNVYVPRSERNPKTMTTKDQLPGEFV